MKNVTKKISAFLVMAIIVINTVGAAFALEAAMPAQEVVNYLATTVGCQNTLEAMQEEDLLTESEVIFAKEKGYLTTAIGLRALMLASGFCPVPNEILQVPVPEKITGTYADVYATAIKMQLVTTDENVLYPMTRTKFTEITEKLSTAQPLEVDYNFNGLMEETTIDRHNYLALNALLVDQYDLPQEYLAQFLNSGWKYKFAKEVVCNDQTYKIGAGLCVFADKTIYLNKCSQMTITHEFGHYLSYLTNVRSTGEYNNGIFTEAKNVRALLREYSMSNVNEYFADCISLKLREPDQWEAFSALAPRTAKMIDGILK